jgi:hypothetical protein
MVWPAIIAALATVASTYVASKATGNKAKNKQQPLQTKEQEEMSKIISDSLKSGGKGPLADLFKGFNANDFEKGVRQPAITKFKEETLPMLLEKLNAGGQTGGSGQARYLGKAGAELEANLANLLYQAQQSGQQNKNANILDLLKIQQSGGKFENTHTPANAGLGPAVLNAGSKFTGQLFANAMNQPSAPSGGGGYNSGYAAAAGV